MESHKTCHTLLITLLELHPRNYTLGITLKEHTRSHTKPVTFLDSHSWKHTLGITLSKWHTWNSTKPVAHLDLNEACHNLGTHTKPVTLLGQFGYSYTTLHKLAIFVKTWNMGQLTFNLYFAQGVVTPIAPYLLPQSESLPKFGCDPMTTPWNHTWACDCDIKGAWPLNSTVNHRYAPRESLTYGHVHYQPEPLQNCHYKNWKRWTAKIMHDRFGYFLQYWDSHKHNCFCGFQLVFVWLLRVRCSLLAQILQISSCCKG